MLMASMKEQLAVPTQHIADLGTGHSFWMLVMVKMNRRDDDDI